MGSSAIIAQTNLGWLKLLKLVGFNIRNDMLQVPYFKQNRYYTCGPVCLRMVLAYWNYETDEVSLSMLCNTNIFGTSANQLVQAARRLGFESECVLERPYSSLIRTLKNGIPPIVAVNATILYEQQHRFYTKHDIVLLEITPQQVAYHDPDVGQNLTVLPATFQQAWQAAQSEVILIWPVEKTFTKKSAN